MSTEPASTGLGRRAAAEALGTGLLLAAVAGSGIMGERLFPGAAGLVLLVNSVATGAVLAALILALGPVSGAHFNPLVTAAEAFSGGRRWSEVPVYAAAQILGAFAGVAAAHAMFGEPLFSISHRARSGPALAFGEAIATFGLLAIALGTAGRTPSASAFAIGAYIAGAYWFTSSTSFANPVVTLARSASDSFVGIRPADVPGFLAAQLLGAAAAASFLRWLTREET